VFEVIVNSDNLRMKACYLYIHTSYIMVVNFFPAISLCSGPAYIIQSFVQI